MTYHTSDQHQSDLTNNPMDSDFDYPHLDDPHINDLPSTPEEDKITAEAF